MNIKNKKRAKVYPESESEALVIGDAKSSPEILDRTFRFAVRMVKFCQQLDERPGVSRTLSSQILRAGTSVGSNIEEAQAGQSKPDFISKMGIALKEARETHYRLRVLDESAVFKSQEFPILIKEADEIKRIIGAIIVSAKRGQTRY